ncbi:MAG: helix-turn-helix transcriptional regulator [Lachnospiraceae bacterium]|nr:helix-turn-helix transcriptional regulator [Lachnospiraceae bacterium]
MSGEHIDIIRNRRIKSLRNSLGLKQKEFAQSVGVSEGLISKVEKGVIPVTDKLITKVAMEYNMNPEWLKGNSEDVNNTDAIYDSQQLRRMVRYQDNRGERDELEIRIQQSRMLEESLKDISGMPDGMALEYLKSVNQCLEKLHMYIFYLKNMDMRKNNMEPVMEDLEKDVMHSMYDLKHLFLCMEIGKTAF